MRYLIALLVLLPVGIKAQNIGIYIDTSGRVAIGHDTVWEPFQVFTETAGNSMQLDQQSGEEGNTSGLLITPTVSAGQSLTCGLTGELHTISLRMSTVDIFESSTLQITVRDGDQPTDPILTAAEFTVSDENLAWYDIVLDPGTFVQIGDALFLEVSHVSGDNGVWDWIEATDEYPDGVSWQFAGTWNELTDSDLVFKSFVSATEQVDVLSVTDQGDVKVHDYKLPPADGLNGQVMTTDGAGVVTWQNVTGAGDGDMIQDADADTKVQVEESADEDIIRFDVGGTEYFRMAAGRLGVYNTGNSILIGDNAGFFDNFGNKRNIFIGTETGYLSTGNHNTAIGFNAYVSNWTGNFNTALGNRAMELGAEGSENTAIGSVALQSNTGTRNTAIGAAALLDNSSGGHNTSIGHSSLLHNTTGSANTGIGWASGGMNSTGSGNIFLGFMAGYQETGSDKLYIENSQADATDALIYGEFDNDLLRINGTLNINNVYSFPTTDGSLGQVLQTNGSGLLSWQTVSGGGGGGTSIEDTDGDTKIQTEETADEDVIRFDLGGTEFFRMDNGRLEVVNTGNSVFIGDGAGANDNGSSNNNTFIGHQSGAGIITGENNSAIGAYAFESNTSGSYNTVHGFQAMKNSVGSIGNCAIGYNALNSNEGSNNVAIGESTLRSNVDGERNVGLGAAALHLNISGNHNTALGFQSLFYNDAGSGATAIGYHAMLYANNSSTSFENQNVAVGYESLRGSLTPSSNTGNENTAMGYQTLLNNSSGYRNTANGYQALFSNTIGLENTAIGNEALRSNVSGILNTAVGSLALHSNTLGSENTAIGIESLYSNTQGSYNTAIGLESLAFNKAGAGGTAIGYRAMLYANDTETSFWNRNVAIGYEALRGSSNPAANTGNYNTAVGYSSLFYNTTGTENVANGSLALFENSSGNFNTATGFEALRNNDDGLRNTATGHSALKNNLDGDNNTAVGIFALEFNESGNNNTALGYSANSNSGDFSNTTGIGYDADPTASNRIHIGNSSVSWIGGQVGWSTYSDGRFKSNITEEVVGLDFINKLRPVTYNVDLEAIQDWKAQHYHRRDSSEYPEKNEIESYRFSGFIAQEVEAASRELDYEFSGLCPPKNEKDFYSLRYAEFVVPLVKAVQELSAENEMLKHQNGELTDLIRNLEMRMAALEGN